MSDVPMLLMSDAKFMIFNVKPFRFPSYAFWEYLFQNDPKNFHAILLYAGAFLLVFLFASARYFLDGSDAFVRVFSCILCPSLRVWGAVLVHRHSSVRRWKALLSADFRTFHSLRATPKCGRSCRMSIQRCSGCVRLWVRGSLLTPHCLGVTQWRSQKKSTISSRNGVLHLLSR